MRRPSVTLRGQVGHARLVEDRWLAGRPAHDAVGLDEDQPLLGHPVGGVHHGLGHGGVVRRATGDARLAVRDLLHGGRVVGAHRDSGRPGGADRHVDAQAALGGPDQGGLDRGAPGRGAPAVPRCVEVLAGAVVHVGDLDEAEARVGDAVDLPLDLDRVDQAVRPPPAEAGAVGVVRRGEGLADLAPGGRAGRGHRGRRGGGRAAGTPAAAARTAPTWRTVRRLAVGSVGSEGGTAALLGSEG